LAIVQQNRAEVALGSGASARLDAVRRNRRGQPIRSRLTKINALPARLPDPRGMIEAATSAATAQRARRRRGALVLGAAIVALEMLDVLTTLRVMRAGGMEANPAMSFLMTWLGPAWWIPKVIVASLVAGYFGTRPSVRWMGVVVLVLGTLVVLNNIAVLLRA
jgi:hypothetical protein